LLNELPFLFHSNEWQQIETSPNTAASMDSFFILAVHVVRVNVFIKISTASNLALYLLRNPVAEILHNLTL
jgi:hypothetical protein